jgi:hypothetical protein
MMMDATGSAWSERRLAGWVGAGGDLALAILAALGGLAVAGRLLTWPRIGPGRAPHAVDRSSPADGHLDGATAKDPGGAMPAATAPQPAAGRLLPGHTK